MAPSRMKPQDRRFTVSENVLTCYRGFEVGNILPVTPLGMAMGRVGSGRTGFAFPCLSLLIVFRFLCPILDLGWG